MIKRLALLFLMACSFSGLVHAQTPNFTHIQGNSAVSGAAGSTSVAVTLPNVKTGDVIACGLTGIEPTTTTTASFVDQAGTAYVKTPHSPTAYLAGAGVDWLFYNLAAPSGSNTVTAKLGATSTIGGQFVLHCDEFQPNGIAFFDTDVANSNAGSGSTMAMNLPSITPSAAGNLLYAVGNPRWNINAAGAPWKIGGSGIQASTGYGLGGTATEYVASAAAGATAVNFTQNNTGAWSAIAASFKVSTTPQAAAPTFSLPPGSFTSTQSVVLSDATAGAVIRFTVDGSTPTASSTVYSAPISVSSTTTIKALATATGFSNSGVSSATYTITLPVVAKIDITFNFTSTVTPFSISSISPLTGPSGTVVTITGQGFTSGGATATVNGTTVPLTFVNATTYTLVMP